MWLGSQLSVWGVLQQEVTTSVTRPPMRGVCVQASIDRGSTVCHSPVQAPDVVVPTKELNFFVCANTRLIALDVWVHFEKCVQSSCACLLRTNHKKGWQLFTALLWWPDFLVPCVWARILSKGSLQIFNESAHDVIIKWDLNSSSSNQNLHCTILLIKNFHINYFWVESFFFCPLNMQVGEQ